MSTLVRALLSFFSGVKLRGDGSGEVGGHSDGDAHARLNLNFGGTSAVHDDSAKGNADHAVNHPNLGDYIGPNRLNRVRVNNLQGLPEGVNGFLRQVGQLKNPPLETLNSRMCRRTESTPSNPQRETA